MFSLSFVVRMSNGLCTPFLLFLLLALFFFFWPVLFTFSFSKLVPFQPSFVPLNNPFPSSPSISSYRNQTENIKHFQSDRISFPNSNSRATATFLISHTSPTTKDLWSVVIVLKKYVIMHNVAFVSVSKSNNVTTGFYFHQL